MNELAQRSTTQLATVIDLDLRAKEAFMKRSLPELHSLYSDLEKHSAATVDFQKHGGDACGCDVALANLLIIIGFAINKRDGEGRYAAWMEDDSLRLLDEYQAYITDCAKDATAAPASTKLTAQLVKAL